MSAGRGGRGAARASELRTFHVHDGPVGELFPVGLFALRLAGEVRVAVGHDDDGDAPVPVELAQLSPLRRRVYVRLYRDIETGYR